MPRARRPLVIAAALLATLVALAAPALAHADLMSAEPQPNTELDEAPTELELDFSEPLEEDYTEVQVLDGNGTDHVERFHIPDEHRDHLQAELAPLDGGVYTVQWQALSSADGHTTSGSYLLAVNASLTDADDGTPGQAPGPDTGGSEEQGTQVGEGGPGEALLRALGFLGASLAAGVPLFSLLARGVGVPAEVSRRWWGTAVAGAGIATAAVLGVAAALAARIELPLSTALATTPGENLLIRAGLFAAALLLLLAGARWRESEHGAAFAASGALAALAGLLVTSLGSHAAADGVGTGLAITVDWVHQAAVAFWVSGVACLAIAGLSRTPVDAAAGLIRRFSPLAVASVMLIVLTGTLATVDRLTSVDDLVSSLYGFALSAKILLLVPLLALGAYHRYRLLPQLETPGHASAEVGRLRRSAFVELGIMVVVLLAAGAMTTTSPPTPLEERTPYASFDDAMGTDTPGPFAPVLADSELATLTEDEAANVTIKLLEPDRIDELSQGTQPVWIALADERGEKPTPITDADVEIEAWMPEHGHGTEPETDPVHVHDGMYEGATNWMMGGAWELRFNVTLPQGDVLRYETTVYIGQQADPLDQRETFHVFEEDGYELAVFLSPEPVRVGVQNLTVRITPTEEPALPENADVVVNLDAPSGTGEGQSRDLERWREDAWTREGAVFTEQGEWGVLVALQGEATYVQTSFTVDVEGR